MTQFIQAWRWYGPNDPVKLSHILQAGATGVVSALHEIPHGDVWPSSAISARQKTIQQMGLQWIVTESVPVHEIIKTGGKRRDEFIDRYRQTLKNLAHHDIRIICYNFMPVLDWTRTDLAFPMPDGSRSLRFDWTDLAIFDIYLLKRKDAHEHYPTNILNKAAQRYKKLSAQQLAALKETILMGVPTERSITIAELEESINIYRDLGKDELRKNLIYFLKSIADVCIEKGIKMTLHPDDPPYPILGLPRIASNKDDLVFILESVKENYNGLCFCTGSLGAGLQNDVLEILNAVKDRVYFAHLRNIIKDREGNFMESGHLNGDVGMPAVINLLLQTMKATGYAIPMRPDHGLQMLDDLDKRGNPGYSAIGRLKGLAELRGVETGILMRHQQMQGQSRP